MKRFYGKIEDSVITINVEHTHNLDTSVFEYDVKERSNITLEEIISKVKEIIDRSDF